MQNVPSPGLLLVELRHHLQRRNEEHEESAQHGEFVNAQQQACIGFHPLHWDLPKPLLIQNPPGWSASRLEAIRL